MRQFLMSTAYILTLTLILCQRSDALANCDGINFGLTTVCPYICRCSGVTACDNDGGCYGPCASGWFGPACQYADLSTSGTTVLGSGKTAKVQSNGWSCLTDSTIDVVTFTWNQTFPFTWLRVIVNSTNSNSNFTVTFRESDSTNSTFISCYNQKVTTTEYDKYRYKKDVHCVVDVPVQQVILIGPDVRHLCSLHISGGRNVALRQYSEISSQHSFYGAAITSPDKAVDGSLATYISTQVTYYNVDDTPNCVVAFTDARLVNRYVIYNYASHKELRGFILESFDSSGCRVFYYQDKQTEVQDVYYVNSLFVQTPIKIVRITATEPTEIGYAVKLLMIRELEAYGDSVCSPGYFGRDCEYTCNCAVTGEPRLVSTGNCPSGCAAGYYEDGCRSENACDKGWFGPSCQYKCHCTNSSCDEMYGTCTDGSKCEHGWFGTACQYEDTVANGSVVYSSGESPDPITDSMIETCANISNPVTLTVTFLIPYPFTWIRFVLQNTSKVETFSISFTDSNNVVIPCVKRSIVDIDDQTRDIHCDVDVLVNSVSVSGDGVGSLCSLYVSGGRNVALRQPTSIYSKNTINSTSFYDFSSLKAVDGFLNVTPNSYDCARTYPTTSLWFINFTSPQMVNRIIVYTTNYQVYEPFVSQYFDELLGKFTVEGYAADYSVVFRNNVDTANPQRIYTLYVNSKLPVMSMRIKGATSYWRVLTLCEVEIFGDTVCPPGTYGRDCEEQCTCNGPCTTATQTSGFYPQYCNTVLPTATIAEDCPAGQGVVDGYIMAGTTATCACVLTEPGYPAGHAQWLTADGKLVGSTGNNVSILSLTNNNLRFRDGLQPYLCKAVSPVVQISNGSIFSPKWAFGPDVVQFTVNLQRSAVVDTGSSLTLFCEVEADPPAYAVIQGNGYGQIKEVKSDRQTLTVTLTNVTCDDSGFYICEGRNGLSKLASGTYDSVDIRVKCE
ncbi:hypothetical protein Btru_055228 [Bulinus truncatus]|nr:hypothetical protein Btru_055228 [Bulinus truncatus]